MLTSDWLLQLVSVMKQRYQGLISEAGSQDSMSTGQMLLCAVNSLLDKVDVDMVQLRDNITSMGTVTEHDWSKFEVVQSSAQVLLSLFIIIIIYYYRLMI